jgi:hypothetical protein
MPCSLCSGDEELNRSVCPHWQSAAIVPLVSGDTAHRCWSTVPATVIFRRIAIRGVDALRRGRIGLTIKPPIGYGSDVSARVLHDLVAIRYPLGGRGAHRTLAQVASNLVA